MSDDAERQRITIVPHGPYIVSGSVLLTERDIETSATGDSLTWEPIGAAKGEQPALAASYALCRCGQSANKPFCDGSHVASGFRAPLQESAESEKGQ